VTEDLLDHADVYALLDEERPAGMPSVVQPGIADAGLSEDGLPLAPVVGAVER
jgi:hypothetical protein